MATGMQSLTELFTNHEYIQLGWHTENVSQVHSPGNKLHHRNCYLIMATGMQSCSQTFNLDSTHSENYSSVHSLYVGVSNSTGYHPSSCKNKHNYTRCTYLQCMPCMRISMTFEPTGDTCALLLVGVAHAFGKVGHVQQSVRKTAKHTLKELEGSDQEHLTEC